jgi:carbamoyltransferase
MNSVANGKIRANTPFKNVYVQPAAADNGTALGAAYHVWNQELQKPRGFVMGHSLWGPEFSQEALGLSLESFEEFTAEDAEGASVLGPQSSAEEEVQGSRFKEAEDRGRKAEDSTGQLSLAFPEEESSAAFQAVIAGRMPALREEKASLSGTLRFVLSEANSDDELCRRTAEAIAAGKVVGWFQGRMEWGARALGNRSIVADPRRTDMRDIINVKIKFREKFRPFAPSILEEAVDEYFEGAVPDPFMIQVYPVREEKRSVIPAVTHVDGSGRLQSVSQAQHPLYWKLIKAFEELTGVPVLLNTSFNENEPIVHKPEEAIDCFMRTDMDVIVMGQFIVEKGD